MTVTSPNVTFRTLMLILLVATVLVGATLTLTARRAPKRKKSGRPSPSSRAGLRHLAPGIPTRSAPTWRENGEFDDDPRAAEERTQSADR
jgi:hypothetical protein